MTSKMLNDGLKAEQNISIVLNADTVVIPKGSAVYLKIGATGDGVLVVAAPQGLASNANFYGIAMEAIAVGGIGRVLLYGYFSQGLVTAAATGSAGATLLPTGASAGVYGMAPGTATALTPHIILVRDLATAGSESARAYIFLRRA